MNARAMLEQAVAENASDIFLVAGRPLSLRKNGVLSMENEERLLPDDTAAFLKEIYELADNRDMRSLLSHGDDDFSFAIPGVSRFRVSAYKQRGTLSAVIRVITFRLPDYLPGSLPIPRRLRYHGKPAAYLPAPALLHHWRLHREY